MAILAKHNVEKGSDELPRRSASIKRSRPCAMTHRLEVQLLDLGEIDMFSQILFGCLHRSVFVRTEIISLSISLQATPPRSPLQNLHEGSSR